MGWAWGLRDLGAAGFLGLGSLAFLGLAGAGAASAGALSWAGSEAGSGTDSRTRAGSSVAMGDELLNYEGHLIWGVREVTLVERTLPVGVLV